MHPIDLQHFAAPIAITGNSPGAYVEYRYFQTKLNKIRVPPLSNRPPQNPPADQEAGGLPRRFLERLAAVMPPDHLAPVVASFSVPRATGFRINPLRAGERVFDELTARGFMIRRIDWLPEANVIAHAQRADLLRDEAALTGQIYVQNPSSMIPVSILDPQAGEKVLDLAAAPGSKTIQIAGRMRARGELAAVEIVRKRFFRLRALLTRHGAEFVQTFLEDGRRFSRHHPEYFDRVLLDAPCSTEGRFVAGDPKTTRYWSERKIHEMAHRQKQLAESAVRCLRPGGTLVYSTCTTAPEENEGVIDWLLERFDGEITVEPVDIPDSVPLPPIRTWKGKTYRPEVAQTIRVAPDETFEAFFVAKVVKR